LVAGTNITFDDTVANIRTISAASGSGTSGSQVVPLNTPASAGFYLTGYSNTTGSFTSGSVTSGVSSLASLSDVSITGSQTDGQALVWSSGSSKWLPGTVASGSGSTTYSTVEYIDQTGGTSDTYGILSGSVNGSNKTFVTSQNKYYTGTLKVYRNGQLQTQGSGSSGDWSETASGSGIFDFYAAPITGDQLTAIYSITAAVSGSSGGSSTLAGLTDVAISGSQLNGQPLVWSSGSAKWIDGVYDLGALQLLKRRAAVNAEDDHFNNPTLAAKWIPFGTASNSLTDLQGWIQLNGDGAGYIQAISGSGNWSIEGEFLLPSLASGSGYYASGLIVSSGSAKASSTYMVLTFGENNNLDAYILQSQKFVNGVYSSAYKGTAATYTMSDQIFLKITKSGTNYEVLWANNPSGNFRRYFLITSLGFTPAYFGIISNSTTANTYCNYFLRY
jgi:hypothetical protein